MKKSKFNYFFEVDGKKLAFNAMSCGLAEIDQDFEEIYENIDHIVYSDLEEKKQKIVDMMSEGFYIIDNDMDEIALLKFRNNKGKYNDRFISFVIAPTMACNFACPYCYEKAKPGIMGQDIQDKIIELAKEAAEQKKDIDFTWYGGEPLLAKKVIYSLSERAIKICEENKVNYSASIITNGYLIEEEDVELFRKYKIESVQITVDGTREIHNTRRVLKNGGEGTFDIIINNIKKLYKKCAISLRVNIDKTNIQDTMNLIDYFKEEGLDQLFVNFGHVSPYTENNQAIKSKCLSVEQYSKESLKLQEYLYIKGFRSSGFPYYPGIKANYCGADSISTFVIDPEGYKYKCWNEVGDKRVAVGNIMWEAKDVPDKMIAREVSYMTWSPFESEDCKECFLLPICMGGCPYTGKALGKNHCERWKYSLQEVLKKTYEQKQTCV